MALLRSIKGEEQLQIRLLTKQEQYAIPDIPYSIAANIGIVELNSLVNTLLKESDDLRKGNVDFDFLVNGEFLRINLGKYLREKDISFEDVIEIEYVERYPAPEPQDCLVHDDWVSAVEANGNWILTGCYDNTLNLWTVKGTHKLTMTGHDGPIKSVSWVSLNEEKGVFVSGSQDQTVMLWEWNIKSNTADCVQICKGHERGVDCVDVNSVSSKIASGGWDNMLKIWPVAPSTINRDETKIKKQKLNQDIVKTPLITLDGHREAISAVQWMDNENLLTSSWDHTIKIWDLHLGGIKTEIPGNKSFFDANYSPKNGMVITASADKNIKVYDPRSTQGAIVKNTYLGHSQWVQTVRWSNTEDYLFISGAYDNDVKLWDFRSPKAPLYDLLGHEDKVLACDWSNPKFIISGGSDNSVKIFKSKKAVKNQE